MKRESLQRHQAKIKLAFLYTLNCSDDIKIKMLKLYPLEKDIDDLINSGIIDGLDGISIKLIKDKTYLKEPINHCFNEFFIIEFLKNLEFVKNHFIEDELEKFGENYNVIGELNPVNMCLCCEFYTLGVGEDYLWSECTICEWMTGEPDPNLMTLEEGKKIFEKNRRIYNNEEINISKKKMYHKKGDFTS